eukprot:7382964-Prymnesium_polylepis.1
MEYVPGGDVMSLLMKRDILTEQRDVLTEQARARTPAACCRTRCRRCRVCLTPNRAAAVFV